MQNAVPGHIPVELVRPFDIYALAEHGGEHQRALKVMQREAGPALFWTPSNGGHWVAARPDVIERVLTEHELFSSRYITVPRELSPTPPIAPLQLDPPASTAYRALLMQALSVRGSTLVAQEARDVARQLAQRLAGQGQCEFIRDFARHLPIACFLKMCGLPADDRERLAGIADLQLDPANRSRQALGYRQMGEYLFGHIQARRAAPGDDLISELARARVGGALLDDYQLFGLVNMLLVAGLDTVSSSMGAIARFLAQHPTHRAELREVTTRIPRAVEELLRRFAMFTAARVVRQDCQLGGVQLAAGDMIVAPTALHGLDEDRFSQPLEVRFDRPAVHHATFGLGAHQCPGATLARAELRVFVEEWLHWIPDFAVDPDRDVRLGAGPVASILSLPLVWVPTDQQALAADDAAVI